MFKELKQKAYASVHTIFLATMLSTSGVAAAPSVEIQSSTEENVGHWKRFHSVAGKCLISLPEQPEHIQQKMALPDETAELKYDVYVAAEEKKAVYMVLIAEYPSRIDGENSEASLESFLNGILLQNPNNELVFADLVDIQGFKGMDFFIKTNNQIYFKGRAVLAKNHLYLLAMECNGKNYQDKHFTHFVNSFEIIDE